MPRAAVYSNIPPHACAVLLLDVHGLFAHRTAGRNAAFQHRADCVAEYNKQNTNFISTPLSKDIKKKLPKVSGLGIVP